jgi:hypothetical protein
MADDRNDAADERQHEPRRGLEGKGFDAGTGYGGAGNDALYNGESAYGGQSAEANSAFGGAYQGEEYGRQDAAQGDAGAPPRAIRRPTGRATAGARPGTSAATPTGGGAPTWRRARARRAHPTRRRSTTRSRGVGTRTGGARNVGARLGAARRAAPTPSTCRT